MLPSLLAIDIQMALKQFLVSAFEPVAPAAGAGLQRRPSAHVRCGQHRAPLHHIIQRSDATRIARAVVAPAIEQGQRSPCGCKSHDLKKSNVNIKLLRP